MLSLFERRKKENISIETSLHCNVFSSSNKLIDKPTPIKKNSNIFNINKTNNTLVNSKNNNFKTNLSIKSNILQNQNK